jgi:hypothetical protein
MENSFENQDPPLNSEASETCEEGDLSDLLGELRVMLSGAQLLTAFLIVLPFNEGFSSIAKVEKYVYLTTFFLSLSSLVLLSGPAIQHRIMMPLRDRVAFKRMAMRQLIAGGITLALAFTLVTDLVMSEVFGSLSGTIASSCVAGVISFFWLLMPLYIKKHTKI